MENDFGFLNVFLMLLLLFIIHYLLLFAIIYYSLLFLHSVGTLNVFLIPLPTLPSVSLRPRPMGLRDNIQNQFRASVG